MRNPVLLSLAVLLFAGCHSSGGSSNIVIREGSSIDTFHTIVAFPYSIKTVHWSIKTHVNDAGRSVPGPNDWSLFAEIKCDSGEIGQFIEAVKASHKVIAEEMSVSADLKREWLSPPTQKCFSAGWSSLMFKSNIYKTDTKIFPSMLSNGWFSIVNDETIFLVLSS